MDDREDMDRLFDVLPTVPVPSALEARILADFDRVSARRRSGLSGLFHRLGEAVWPGAPLWRPAAVLGAALLIGVTVGVVVPLEDSVSESETQSIALDTAPSFEIGENS
jgi:hypothetical protein